MKSIFITSTDTGAGKTYLCTLIIKTLRAMGLDAVGYKPICCGGREDAYALMEASQSILELDEVNPCYLRTAAAPYVAAMFENFEIEIKTLITSYQNLARKHEVVIVEGVGGWMVPIKKDYMLSEFAKDLGLPVFLVVANRLGAINHSLLSLQSIRASGIEPAGMIFNNLKDEIDSASVSNRKIVEELSGIPVLCDVICGQDEIDLAPILSSLNQLKLDNL